ncbi:MAG: GC-type dockerin domain-anchored protein [Phycisphaerales bacterium]
MKLVYLFVPFAIAPSALGQVTFEPLGDLPGGGAYSEAWGLSSSGEVVVGASVVGGSGFSLVLDGLLWTQESGAQPLFGTTTGPSARAHGASADGSIVAGVADYGAFNPLGSQAFVWSASSGMTLIGDLPGGSAPRGVARGISDDGTVVVGIGESALGTQAWRYHVPSGVFTPLNDLAGGAAECYAYAVSDDGRVAVGIGRVANGTRAARWVDAGQPQNLETLPNAAGFEPNSAAEAVNADGSVVVGWSRSTNSPQGAEAFLWRQGQGLIGLGDLPTGAFQSWAYGVSADGSVVVGRASIAGPCGPFGCGSEGRAFIWDAANGMRDLQQLATDAGADLTGWKLTEARAVSADGRVITGNGFNPSGAGEAWRLSLAPARCIGDFTRDGAVDSDDVISFFGAWDAADPAADVTADGGVDSDDVILFFARWDAGC